ncbi:MAG: response regulator [Candidatus Saccharimonas sp.]
MTKVLLVEDDKSLREIYAVRLVEEGYDIVSAGDGEEALAMAIKERPALIISDVMMPKISGFDMLDILRSTTETRDIKVIMMTALSSEDQRQRGVSLGADRYLVKSQVGIEDVVRTVHEVLADAPVAGQPPLTANTTQPVAAPAPPAAAAPVAAAPAPVAPLPVVPPRPQPVAAAPSPVVATVPTANPITTAAPQSVPASPSQPANPSSTLPQPTAPFSTPRTGTLAGRVIEPLKTDSTNPAPSVSTMMEKELAGTQPAPAAAPIDPAVSSIAPPPVPPTPPIPVAPIAPSSSDLSFEETPRPAAQPTAASVPPQPPATPGVV